MSQLFYAFGIGISFSLGIMTGACLGRLAAQLGAEKFKEYNNKMLKIMERNSRYSERTTDAIEDIRDIIERGK
jgi:hypothetical protein